MKILNIDIGNRKLVLGSSSAGRKMVIESLGVPFEVASPDIDEKTIRHEDPKELTCAIANAKADALVATIKEPAIIITADHVVVYGGVIREKATDENEAREFLKSYNDAPADILGTMVVHDVATGRRTNRTQLVRVFFKPLSDDFIDKYIRSGKSLVGAGGFGLVHEEIRSMIDHIDGTQEGATGLDKDLLLELIREVLL